MSNYFLRTLAVATLMASIFSLQACKEDIPETEIEPSEPPRTVEFKDGQVILPTETACGVFDTLGLSSENVSIGQIVLANDIDSFYVTIQTQEDWFVSDVRFFKGDRRNIPVTEELLPNLDEFPVKLSIDPLVQNYQYSISLDEFSACEDILVNVGASRVDQSGSVLESGNFWMEGQALEGVASQGTYVQYCLEECIVKYPASNVATMAFEDLYPEPGDSDYNDFVTGMSADAFYKGNNLDKVDMVFTALARGTGFEHDFRIGFPIEGTVDVIIRRYSSPEATEPYEVEELIGVGGTDFNFSVFPNTKEVLPPQDRFNHTNTNAGTNYIAPPRAEVELIVKEGNALLPVPFDPYLVVTNLDGVTSEVHIAELTQEMDRDGDGNKDYWDEGESIYPFGIVMFTEWAWPLEFENILDIYPNFEYVFIDGIFRPRDPEWYLEPVEGTNYFKKDLFN